MDLALLPLYLYAGSSLIVSIVWAVRQEGRITGIKDINDQRAIDAKELVNVKLDAIDKRLERIERLILNGNGHG